jgi:hypothetical protein
MNREQATRQAVTSWHTWQEAMERNPQLRTPLVLLHSLTTLLTPYREQEAIERLLVEVEEAMVQERHYDALYGLLKLLAACLSATQPQPPAAAPSEAPSFAELGLAVGQLVERKNRAYGDSFRKSGAFLRLLYPNGIQPEQYDDALLLVRIFDKQMRIATAKGAFDESPYEDIAGYGLLGLDKDRAGGRQPRGT